MKIFSKIFSLIFIAITFFSFSIAQAQSNLKPTSNYFDIDFSTGCIPGDNGQCSIGWIGEYISAVYNYGVAMAAVLAVVAIMVGGFIWLSSAGSPDKVKSGQNIISGALTGLVLALFSFVILQTVNPRLVALEPLQIKVIPKVQLSYVSPVPNQDCKPPNTFYPYTKTTTSDYNAALAGASYNCSEACSEKGGEHSTQPIYGGKDGEQTGFCCTCRGDSNGCLTNDQGSCAQGSNSSCCPGLVCNSFIGNECKPPGDRGDYCKITSECLPGLVCNTTLFVPTDLVGSLFYGHGGQCCTPGGVGATCSKYEDCRQGLICNPCGITGRARCTQDTSPNSSQCSGNLVDSCAG